MPGHGLGTRNQTESECWKTETEIGTPARVEAETWKSARQRGSSRALGTRGLYVLWNYYAANSHAATPAVFFLPNIFCVHVRKLGTSVRKSMAKSDLQNLQNRYQCPFGADKPLICHSEKRYTRAKSRILSLRKPCACMRSLSRHGLLGGFSVKLILCQIF